MQKAVRDALIGFMAAMAEASAEASKAVQRAGIEHARASEPTAYLGRAPSFGAEKVAMVRDMLAAGHGVSAVARRCKGNQAVAAGNLSREGRSGMGGSVDRSGLRSGAISRRH
jgi:DNA invertase Pin-like site-specific DNA recombinase